MMWGDWVVAAVFGGALCFGLYSIIFRRRISLSMIEADSFRSSAALLHTQFGRARLRLDRKLLEAKRLGVFARLERRRRVVAMVEAERGLEGVEGMETLERSSEQRAEARRRREAMLRDPSALEDAISID